MFRPTTDLLPQTHGKDHFSLLQNADHQPPQRSPSSDPRQSVQSIKTYHTNHSHKPTYIYQRGKGNWVADYFKKQQRILEGCLGEYNLSSTSGTRVCCSIEAYISDTSNECSINLSTEEDGDCTKFQKVDVQSNVQITPTSILKENKRTYVGTTMKQQRKKIQKTL